MILVFISYTQWQRLLRLFIHATLTFRLIENSMHMCPIQNVAFQLITKKLWKAQVVCAIIAHYTVSGWLINEHWWYCFSNLMNGSWYMIIQRSVFGSQHRWQILNERNYAVDTWEFWCVALLFYSINRIPTEISPSMTQRYCCKLW